MRLLAVLFFCSACTTAEVYYPTFGPPVSEVPDVEPWSLGTEHVPPLGGPAVDTWQPLSAHRVHPQPSRPQVSVFNHPEHPLLAFVDVHCKGVCASTVRVDGPGIVGRQVRGPEGESDFRILLSGLRSSVSYDLTVQTRTSTGDVVTSAHEITTGMLGFIPAPITLTQSGDPQGSLLLAYYDPNSAEGVATFLALDNEAEVVWFYRWPKLRGLPPQIRPLSDGTFLVHVERVSRIIDVQGRVLRQWEQGAEQDRWHHDVDLTEDGHLLALASESARGNLDGEEVNLLSDTVLEYDESGTVVQRWSAADTFDTSRFPGPLSTLGGELLDWTHGNAVTVTPDNDGYLVSLRHQHWVVRVDRDTAGVDWVLGEGGDFELLAGTWFDSQHDPTFVSETELLIYDNGTERYMYYEGAGSRVVKYSIDEDRMEARQTWSWDLPVYTPFVGGVQSLSGGDVLVAAGGQLDGSGDVYRVGADGRVQWSIEVETLFFRAELMRSW